MIDHIDGLSGILEHQVITMLNNDIKEIEEEKAQLEQGDRDMEEERCQTEREAFLAEENMYKHYGD